MSQLNAHKFFVTSSALDLFTTKQTQNGIDDGFFEELRPVNSLDSQGCIEFRSLGSDAYTDCAHAMYFCEAQIIEKGGNEITATDTAAPCNDFMDALFKCVGMELNGRVVSNASNLQHYRAFIEKTLNYGRDAKLTHLESALYCKDEAGKMDSVTSSGFQKRKKFMSKNGIVSMFGFIHSELMGQSKMMLNHVDTCFKFYRSEPGFAIMKDKTDKKEYDVKIINMSVLLRKVRVNALIQNAHMTALTKGVARYPINRVLCRSVTIPKDIQSKVLDNILSGPLPKRLYLTFVSGEAFNGSSIHNPFNFQHFDIQQIHASSNAHVNLRPFKFDFDNQQFIEGYMSVFNSSNIKFNDTGNDISRNDYANGQFYVGWDLTPDLAASSDHKSVTTSGSLKIELIFKKKLQESINVLIYAEFENEICVDIHRNVLTDYS